MTDIWTPLSTRQGTGEGLRDDIPNALDAALRPWIEKAAGRITSGRILLRCDLVRDEEHGPGPEVDEDEFLAWYTPKDRLLDVVDALLDLLPPRSLTPVPNLPVLPVTLDRKPGVLETLAVGFTDIEFRRHREPLQQLLDDGRSAYTIRADGRALVHRVSPTATALLRTAVRAAAGQPDRGSAGDHLKRAHAAAYALHPEPGHAYNEAVKAVECAAHATVEPNNTMATLGTMLRVLRQSPGQWDVALPGKTGAEGEEAVRSLISLLWTGQSSRHGGQQATREETLDAARMAVDIAVSLVRWFSDGAIRRR
ncbi:hypothetical protein OG806_49590 [Streptomyces sp. NBC_00882]|uniref:hypothetical protein n=1 Tax=Streptomyces sp. NBC_00882 TaxID=2975856 RepID=UPI003866E270|nr:hypothetical protein OG806_00360 [Streptomyces sp. NBC_00882]WSZ36871.1 hypothetical protein OG806_49590 [Streptomyces sp. NBC_00882]